MKTVNFINLTNGLELLDLIPNPHFVRIQSTACEQKRWDFIIQDLDHTFLLNLAIGNHCVVWDCSHKGESRAIWQGLPWIKFALENYWWGNPQIPFVKKHNVLNYFGQCYKTITEETKSKLSYYFKFIKKSRSFDLDLTGKSMVTHKDGNYVFFVKEAYSHLT